MTINPDINILEREIIANEHAAEDQRWRQAEAVAADHARGLTHRDIAAQWINARTGRPYDRKHVRNTIRVLADLNPHGSRPRFRDVYNAVANGRAPKLKPERSRRHDALVEQLRTVAATANNMTDVLVAMGYAAGNVNKRALLNRIMRRYAIAFGGLGATVASKDDIHRRREQRIASIRRMAADGHSPAQIASALDVTPSWVAKTIHEQDIHCPAVEAMGRSRRPNAVRIMDTIVMAATDLTQGVQLVDLTTVDPMKVIEWHDALIAARKQLSALIGKLSRRISDVSKETTQKGFDHVEAAAEARPIQGLSDSDQ